MANRVLFGQRNDEYGLWISKPGYNVLTASENDMLFLATPNRQTKALQLIQQGTFAWGSGQAYVDIATPGLGFNPMATGFFDQNAGLVTINYPGFGTVRFNRYRANGVFEPTIAYNYSIINLKMD